MEMKSISGVVYVVANVDRTLQFYEKLGFRVGAKDAGQPTVYLNWFWIEFRQGDSQETAIKNDSALLYIKVASIDEHYAGVKSLGFTPEGEPYGSLSGGREFMLRDPDGYPLVFFEK